MKTLIIVPHPDDELLGCWGYIKERKNKEEITITLVTDGCHGASPRFKGLSGQELINERQREFIDICKRLDIHDYLILNQPEGNIDLKRVASELEDRLRECNCIITTHYEDKHIDHKRLGDFVRNLKGDFCKLYFCVNPENRKKINKAPQLKIKLGFLDRFKRKRLLDRYETQRHLWTSYFLRKDISIEEFWKE